MWCTAVRNLPTFGGACCPEDGSSTFLRTWVNFCQTARGHIPKDCNIQCHRHESPKPRASSQGPFVYNFFCLCPRKKERVYSEGDANLASFVKLKISRWLWAEHCVLGFLGVVHCRVCQFLYSFCCGNTQCVRNEEVTCKFMTFDRRTRVIGKPMVHTIVRRIILWGIHFLVIIRVSECSRNVQFDGFGLVLGMCPMWISLGKPTTLPEGLRSYSFLLPGSMLGLLLIRLRLHSSTFSTSFFCQLSVLCNLIMTEYVKKPHVIT